MIPVIDFHFHKKHSMKSFHIDMAKHVTLVHPEETLQVRTHRLIRKCDLFANDPGLAAVPYHLKSRVSLRDFYKFVSALEGTQVKIRNSNFKALSQLCEEFGFRDLAAQLSQFRESGNFTDDVAFLSALKERVLALEEQMHRDTREIALLRSEVSRQSAVTESFEEKIRMEVEKSVADVRSQVDRLSRGLMEVRALANAADMMAKAADMQAKAADMQARCGPRLGPEVLVPRIMPAMPIVRPAEKPTSEWKSAIIPDFPKLFEDFRGRKYSLLWRGTRDGFSAHDFYSRCNGHPNTLTLILDTSGNIFGGFTPAKWDCGSPFKGDPSLKSFIFTLTNPHRVAPRRFALKVEQKDKAICCRHDWGPHFGDIFVSGNGDANPHSFTHSFGTRYTNDTGLEGRTFLTGSANFRLKEIEVFEIVA
jgi:hypothetical protein